MMQQGNDGEAGAPRAAANDRLASAACSARGKAVMIGGKSAQIYCGPAKATVRVGGETMTFRNGTCTWTCNSFKLQLGTIFLYFLPRLEKSPLVLASPSSC